MNPPSLLYTIEKEKLIQIINNSSSVKEVLLSLELNLSGGRNHKLFKQRCIDDNIDLSALKQRASALMCHRMQYAIPDEELFTANSNHSRNSARRRLIDGNLIPYKCAICGMEPEWNGQPLSLVLDHINGVNNDHRLENLRFLCPNCNSQTETFAGRNQRIEKNETNNYKKQLKCKNCSKPICDDTDSGYCIDCYGLLFRRKVERPTKEELEEMLNTMNWCEIGRKYGVSDNAVRKWAKKYGLKD